MKKNALLFKCFSRNFEQVFTYRADHYRETIKLHTYHNHKRVWTIYSKNKGKAIIGTRRAKQIEKICRLSGWKCKEEYTLLGAVGQINN